MLQNVVHLIIRDCGITAPPNLWWCLAAYFGHPCLRSLSILTAYVPALVLSHAASSVPHVELRDVRVDAHGAHPPAEIPSAQLTLAHLQFSYCNYDDGTKMTPMHILSYLHGLKWLEIELAYEEDLDNLTKVAQVCKHGLEQISLSRRVMSGPFYQLPNFPPMESLRFIELRFFTFSGMVGLSDLLATIPTASQIPCIEAIKMSIEYADFVVSTRGPEFDFDAGLMSHPYLHRMCFRLVFKSASSIDGGRSVLGEYIRKQLLKTQESGVLVTVTVESKSTQSACPESTQR
ncbi:hypothetical protein MVEN_02559900 [Mycena venus]|uniref:Uncharacterized protein n=1 Tax=Mycena venus TaxID=2733690 RepID=A0A8H6WSF4_9AGAR|nr:hypothetical protein MVEN_02559900 [Mycena venus]